jgi:hypothetical protein
MHRYEEDEDSAVRLCRPCIEKVMMILTCFWEMAERGSGTAGVIPSFSVQFF